MSNLKSRDDYIFTRLPEGAKIDASSVRGGILSLEKIIILMEIVSERLVFAGIKASLSVPHNIWVLDKSFIKGIMESLKDSTITGGRYTGLTDAKGSLDPGGLNASFSYGGETNSTRNPSRPEGTVGHGSNYPDGSGMSAYLGDAANRNCMERHIMDTFKVSDVYMERLDSVIRKLSNKDKTLDGGTIDECIDIASALDTAIIWNGGSLFDRARGSGSVTLSSLWEVDPVTVSYDDTNLSTLLGGRPQIYGFQMLAGTKGDRGSFSSVIESVGSNSAVGEKIRSESSSKTETWTGETRSRNIRTTMYRGRTAKGSRTWISIPMYTTFGGAHVTLTREIEGLHRTIKVNEKLGSSSDRTVECDPSKFSEVHHQGRDGTYRSTVQTIAYSSPAIVKDMYGVYSARLYGPGVDAFGVPNFGQEGEQEIDSDYTPPSASPGESCTGTAESSVSESHESIEIEGAVVSPGTDGWELHQLNPHIVA